MSNLSPLPSDKNSAMTGELELILFQCADMLCALPIQCVKEINKLPRVTRGPHAKPAVLGCLSLRGDVITVIDLARILQKESADKRSRMLVVQHGGERIALAVNEVLDVVCVDAERVQPPPSNFKQQFRGQIISRVMQRDQDLVYVLDLAETLAI